MQTAAQHALAQQPGKLLPESPSVRKLDRHLLQDCSTLTAAVRGRLQERQCLLLPTVLLLHGCCCHASGLRAVLAGAGAACTAQIPLKLLAGCGQATWCCRCMLPLLCTAAGTAWQVPVPLRQHAGQDLWRASVVDGLHTQPAGFEAQTLAVSNTAAVQ